MDGTVLDQEEVRQASRRLPERQREALTLLELERLSYEEIAATMGMSAGSVAHLISLARINLYDELRGTALASVPPSRECERSLSLIAAREDGQLEAGSDDAAWLDAHLSDCDRCGLAVEQMGEAGAFYRGEKAVGAVPAPVEETAAAVGPDGPRGADDRRQRQWTWPRGAPRRRMAAVAALAALLLGGVAAALVGDDGTPAPAKPAAEAAVGRGNGESPSGAGAAKADEGAGKNASKAKKKITGERTAAAGTWADHATAGETASTPVNAPASTGNGGGAPTEPASSPTHPSGKTGVEPTQQTSTTRPGPKTKSAPTSTQTSQPAPAPATTTATTTEASPPAEEPADEPGHRGEPPGKPADRPPR